MNLKFLLFDRTARTHKGALAGWFLLAVALVCGAITVRAETVPDSYLKVVSREEGGRTHFYVQNLQVGNVTATFDLQLVNMTGNTNFPCTVTLEGKKTVEVFSLAPLRKDARWTYHYNYACNLGSAAAVHDDAYVYELPYAPGNAYRVVQGHHGAFSHTGQDEYAIDWKMPVGTPVHAARGGLVVSSKDDSTEGGPDRCKYDKLANYVMVQHTDGTIGMYLHLQAGGNRVQAGDEVKAGDLLGLSGNTGFSSGPHLHFAVFTIKSGSERLSLPVRFRTADRDAVIPVSGHAYMAPIKAIPSVAQTASR